MFGESSGRHGHHRFRLSNGECSDQSCFQSEVTANFDGFVCIDLFSQANGFKEALSEIDLKADCNQRIRCSSLHENPFILSRHRTLHHSRCSTFPSHCQRMRWLYVRRHHSGLAGDGHVPVHRTCSQSVRRSPSLVRVRCSSSDTKLNSFNTSYEHSP